MSDDPTGMGAAIAEIPEAQLSERSLRIAAGLALIRDQNKTVNAAAKEVGVAQSTLWRHQHKLPTADTENGVRANEQALVAASFDIAQIAAAGLTERLLDATVPKSTMELAKVYGIATDKIATRMQWNKGIRGADERSQDALADALQTIMEQGGKVSIEQPEPSDEAIDVTPEPPR